MKIEILYFSGCPNHSPAVGQVKEALLEEGVPAEMIELEVKDTATAIKVGFLGSPSIRVNGQDIELSARSAQTFGLMCRTYPNEGRRAGVPPVDWIRAALRETMGDVRE
jgi:hypothetical protein